VGSDGCIGARRIVRDVADTRTRGRAIDALNGVRNRVWTSIDDSVEIGEHKIDSIEGR
jgi:hypothetical protein